MKITSATIIDTVAVYGTSGKDAIDRYTTCRIKNLWSTQRDKWLDLKDTAVVPQTDIRILSKKRKIAPFTVAIVSYEGDHTPAGPSLADALNILKKAQVEIPTLFHTIVLASQTLWTREMSEISSTEADREIIVPVPINPDAPFYYSFGIGVQSCGSFSKKIYRMAGRRKYFKDKKVSDLYFWNISRLKCFSKRPLFLGVITP